MKDRRDICGVLAASNVVMVAFDEVLTAYNGKIPRYDGYMYVNVRVSNKAHLFVII